MADIFFLFFLKILLKYLILLYSKGMEEFFKILGTPEIFKFDIKCLSKFFLLPRLADKYQSCQP